MQVAVRRSGNARGMRHCGMDGTGPPHDGESAL